MESDATGLTGLLASQPAPLKPGADGPLYPGADGPLSPSLALGAMSFLHLDYSGEGV